MSDKLSLFPKNAAIDQTGQLTIQNLPATELAAQFGTPLYVYDVDTIRQQIAAYRRGLATYKGNAHLAYASKAFQCTALAQLLVSEAVGFDVASAGEIFIAQNGGADPTTMHMHGNNKTIIDLQLALDTGVGRIVVDNAAELALLSQMTQQRQQMVKIWLRITPGIPVDTVHSYTLTGAIDSKFGFPIDQAKAIAQSILTEPTYAQLDLVGLHLHLGSHFYDAEPVAEAIDRLLDLAKGLQQKHNWALQELCAGGGWGVRYHPADPPMPVEPFVEGLVAALQISCHQKGLDLPALTLEPGRSLVAQAGVALYTVGGRKVIPNTRTYVSIDGGLADNPRPAIYQAKYTALIANKATQSDIETVAIAGPFCESGDVLIQSVDLPVAEPGDILAVPVSGAYHLSMASNYNAALKPAVLFIENNQARVVQRREMLEDIIKRDE